MRKILVLLFILTFMAIPEAEAGEIYVYYFPFMVKSTPNNVGVAAESSVCKKFNPNTTLKVYFRWPWIETEPGVYDWTRIDSIACGYPITAANVQGTPPFYLKDNQLPCELPEGKNKDRLYEFLILLLKRYPEIKYLEIGNEPQAMPRSAQLAQYIGCASPTYLGELYDHFYNWRVKNDITIQADVLIGSLSDVYDEEYILEMLEEAQDHYDGFSFHCYGYYSGKLYSECTEAYKKAQSYTDKPVYWSEGAVIYHGGTLEGFYDAQIEFYNEMKSMPTPFWWYTLPFNGWPNEFTIGIQVMSCDMYGRNLTTGEEIERPIHKVYMEEPLWH